MTTIQHPSQWLNREIASQIREHSFAAESQKNLTPEQLKIIYDNKWFKMFVPTRLGGLGLTLPEVLRIEEGLAWADGSTAWVVTLCSGAGWFVGFLDPAITQALTADARFCIAGSGAATGTADINDQGYFINGSWKYASGSLHATAFTVNCMITKKGEQLYNPDGSPKIQTFILKPDEVTVRRTWSSMGMVATGSHSFDIRSQQVSMQRSFTIDPAHAVLPDPIYQYPFLQLAETTLAVNISGMAARFVDLCEDLKVSVVSARTILDQARQSLFEVVDNPTAPMTEVSAESHRLVKTSRDVVNSLYPLCGLRAADQYTEINRVWRNLHTAAQHSLFRAS